MPKFVQQVAGKTLSLFEPRLDWAREKISILGETAGSLKGTYIEPRLDWAREKNCASVHKNSGSSRFRAGEEFESD